MYMCTQPLRQPVRVSSLSVCGAHYRNVSVRVHISTKPVYVPAVLPLDYYYFCISAFLCIFWLYTRKFLRAVYYTSEKFSAASSTSFHHSVTTQLPLRDLAFIQNQ